jgi:hypothetical protein
MTECERWLAEILSKQRFINCEKVRQIAKTLNFSKSQLSTARKILGVTTVNDASLHDGKAENWFWLIPREVSDDERKYD